MGDFIQKSFVGGLNRMLDPTRIKEDEYSWMRNLRNRYDVLSPIRSPIELSETLPATGKLQGIYSAGSIVVVFISGKPYARDYATDSGQFTLVGETWLDPDVDTIYAEIVPDSYMNNVRKLNGDSDSAGYVPLFGIGSSTPQCMIAQDGINQPLLMFPNGTTRRAASYNDWDVNGIREYVPIGKQMLYHDGILYIVAPEGNQIYRSVTGRALDFMVIIDVNGNKLATEAEGGASNISHRVDYNTITALRSVGAVDGSFFVGTQYNSYLVLPDYANTLYGEPKFKTMSLFDVGPLNNFSVMQILGDAAIVSTTGVHSFNAINQVRFQGKNSPFSAKVNDIIDNVEQSTVCCIDFDNYAMFALNTKYGFAVMIYDQLSQTWTSIDQYEDVGAIKQFCVVKTSSNHKLFFITADNKYYEAFASEVDFELGQVYIGEFCSNNPKVVQEPLALKLVFIDAVESGTFYAQSFLDRQAGNRYNKFLRQSITNKAISTLPFADSSQDTAQVQTIDIARDKQCWKVGFLIEWAYFVMEF